MKRSLVLLCSVMLLVLNGCNSMEQRKVMLEKNAVVLDVRTPEEQKEGYLDGAILLPLAGLDSEIVNKVPAEDTPIYIYCRSGRRAGIAVEKLKAMGYTDLHNLGGLKDAQEKLALPIRR